MAVPKPGEFITAKCGRCNDITGHVVMLVVSGEITKVECKACGSVHKYRDIKKPSRATAPSAGVRHVRAGQAREEGKNLGSQRRAAPQSSRSSAAKNAARLESAWQEAMVRHSAEMPVPYAMNAAFAVGMFVEHPHFGRGEVIQVTRPDKVEILFQDGLKILRCSA